MKRRKFLQLCAASSAGVFAGRLANSLSAAPTGAARGRPNVVVIYVDDLDPAELACYGGGVATPHIDALAADGVRFTRFYVSSSLCSPSRYTALTGRYASRNLELREKYPAGDQAFILWNTPLTRQETTLPRILQANGYVTGMVGKWHNGKGALEPVANGEDPAEPSTRKKIEANYKKAQEAVRDRGGFDCAEAVYGDNFNFLPITSKLKFHNQEWLTQKAVDFIASNKARPFFLYISTTIPHAPSVLPSLKQSTRVTPAGYLDKPIEVQPSRDSVLARAREHVAKRGAKGVGLRTVAGMIWLDDGVGAVMDRLKALGLYDNTLIILASDNGKGKWGKNVLNRGQIPCMVTWKNRVRGGQVNEELASNIDFAPTVLDACRAEPSPGAGLDGRSLLPLLAGAGGEWRDSLYLEVTYTRGVATKRWKYIATRFPEKVRRQIAAGEVAERELNQEGSTTVKGKKGMRVRYNSNKVFPGYYDRDQLYDLAADPGEQKNLAADPAHAAVLAELKKKLADYSRNLPHTFGEFKE